jgi:hypothetical protein
MKINCEITKIKVEVLLYVRNTYGGMWVVRQALTSVQDVVSGQLHAPAAEHWVPKDWMAS